MMNLPIRPRRNRKSANIRGLIRETSLSPEHLIYPVFVHEGTGNQPIPSLPGCTRWSVKGLVEEAKRLMDLGIDIQTISALLGHQSAKTTLDFYGHSLSERQIYAASLLASC